MFIHLTYINIYIQREIDLLYELDHMFIEAKKFHNLLSASQRTRKADGIIQSKCQGLRIKVPMSKRREDRSQMYLLNQQITFPSDLHLQISFKLEVVPLEGFGAVHLLIHLTIFFYFSHVTGTILGGRNREVN